MKSCVEIVSYQLKTGTREEDYMKYVNLLQERLCEISGFIQREVFYNKESGVWVEIVEWESESAAKHAESQIMQESFMLEAMGLIMESTIHMHFVKQII